MAGLDRLQHLAAALASVQGRLYDAALLGADRTVLLEQLAVLQRSIAAQHLALRTIQHDVTRRRPASRRSNSRQKEL